MLLEGDDAASAAVYACGPPAMLEAVRALCAERGVAAELAMEAPMACGFGACFGCAVPLAGGGYMRLCVDGPVVRGDEIETALVAGSGPLIDASSSAASSSRAPDPQRLGNLRRDRGAARLRRRSCSTQFPFTAFVSKTITPEPRAGNPPPRLWETPAGMINSIGLPNKGLEGFLEHGPARSSPSCRCR